ncbi:M56 family metallopeptidase [Solicola gregarius]|uniref:M56 family metallopeptidase n=1 Tax=Solicola gregarius TaxID=2908642 RepID=A0AA46TIU6_9ACTN|nr:M56 family metallopeptidase [Solicola gregarius]UYM05674.1 M56 family metallopeptidase [Solicola gregarius]
MNAVLGLLVFAVAASTVAVAALRRAAWTHRAPRLAIAMWQALSASMLASLILAGAAMAVPALPLTTDAAELLHTCAMTLRAMYTSPGGAAAAIVAGAVTIGLTARVTYCLVDELLRARSQRRRQEQTLALVAHDDHRLGVTIVDHPDVAAYCMPGRRRRVVLTSAAVDALDTSQRSAIVAHELAHLRARHHLVIAAARALHRAVPVPPLRVAASEVIALVEMAADDAAAARHDRFTVAGALVRMAEMKAPAGALGAAGSATSLARRVNRLVDDPARMRPLTRGAVLLVLAGVLLVPLALAASPAYAATAIDYCPVMVTPA